MNATIKLSKTAAVKAILAATFPQYKGRTIRLVVTPYQPTVCAAGWDGNTKIESRLYNTRSGGVVYVHDGRGALTNEATYLEGHWLIVEHSVFCGKDAGITIRIRSILDVDAWQVSLDRALECQDIRLAAAFLAEQCAGEQWGCYDATNVRVTRLDLTMAGMFEVVNQSNKAIAKAKYRADAECR